MRKTKKRSRKKRGFSSLHCRLLFKKLLSSSSSSFYELIVLQFSRKEEDSLFQKKVKTL